MVKWVAGQRAVANLHGAQLVVGHLEHEPELVVVVRHLDQPNVRRLLHHHAPEQPTVLVKQTRAAA